MALSIQTLFDNTKDIYSLSLIAGPLGLQHSVSWVYYTEDASTIDFIRGGELAITTGMNIARTTINTGIENPLYIEEYLTTLIKKLQSLNASGIIINTGRYINEIPETIIQLCNDLFFPLFTMPWNIHMVDLMQDYGNRIINEKKEYNTISQCFYNLLFQPQKFNIEDLHKTKFENTEKLAIIVTEKPYTTDKTIDEYINSYLDFAFTEKIGLNSVNYCCFTHDKKIIFVVSENPEYIAGPIYQICNSGNYITGMSLGISDISTINQLKTEYQHAILALRFANKENPVVFYHNLGIYRIFGELQDSNILQQMYNEQLEKMEILDETKKDDYLKTLKLYLESGNKVLQTAEENSLHRNTVNYRIRKIRDILGYDLQDGAKNFLLLNALYIKEILTKKINSD
jgi:hypothetical protein